MSIHFECAFWACFKRCKLKHEDSSLPVEEIAFCGALWQLVVLGALPQGRSMVKYSIFNVLVGFFLLFGFCFFFNLTLHRSLHCTAINICI